jgi:hypothetical protein
LTGAGGISSEYAAGFFDGEGAVMISRGSGTSLFLLSCTVTQTDRRPLDLLKEKYAGKVMLGGRRPDGRKPIYYWSVDAALAESFLLDIQPYLIVKAERVKLALEFRELFKGPNVLPRGKLVNDLEAQRQKRERILADRRSFYDQMRILNKRGVSDGN